MSKAFSDTEYLEILNALYIRLLCDDGRETGYLATLYQTAISQRHGNNYARALVTNAKRKLEEGIEAYRQGYRLRYTERYHVGGIIPELPDGSLADRALFTEFTEGAPRYRTIYLIHKEGKNHD